MRGSRVKPMLLVAQRVQVMLGRHRVRMGVGVRVGVGVGVGVPESRGVGSGAPVYVAVHDHDSYKVSSRSNHRRFLDISISRGSERFKCRKFHRSTCF